MHKEGEAPRKAKNKFVFKKFRLFTKVIWEHPCGDKYAHDKW